MQLLHFSNCQFRIFYWSAFVSLNICNFHRKMELTVSFNLKHISNHLVIILFFFPRVNFHMILCHIAVGVQLPVLQTACIPSPDVHSCLPAT